MHVAGFLNSLHLLGECLADHVLTRTLLQQSHPSPAVCFFFTVSDNIVCFLVFTLPQQNVSALNAGSSLFSLLCCPHDGKECQAHHRH